MIEFFCAGTPAPKGSKKAFRRPDGRISLVESAGVRLRSWSGVVGEAAMMAMDGREVFVRSPLWVELVFALKRPLSHSNKSGLKKNAPTAPHVKPDCDKLVRATLDPLSNVVFDDDSRIVQCHANKIYAQPGQPTGALIKIGEVETAHFAECAYSQAVERFLSKVREGIL